MKNILHATVLVGVTVLGGCNDSQKVQRPEYKVPAGESAYLPGDKVLNNQMNWKPSPVVEYSLNDSGFASDRISPVPAPGVHPRILMSPEDIPAVRKRLETTLIGARLLQTAKDQLNRTIYNKGSKYQRAYQALLDGDFKSFQKIDAEEELGSTGHYQKAVTYEIMLQAFIAMIYNDEAKGKDSAAAITTWAAGMQPTFAKWREHEDNSGRYTSTHACGSYMEFDMQRLGYTYDFAYNFMDEAQRSTVRETIATLTEGAYVFGMELPPHFRMWNWINVGSCFTLLALAIEGEEGYDERIYPKAVETLTDYIIRNYSKMGSSTEAAGYTSFGWGWGAPMLVAMARRGDNLMAIDRYREISKWHAAATLPDGSGVMTHGDGGNHIPRIPEMQVMKYFYPDDPVVDYNWQNFVLPLLENDKRIDAHMIAPMVCALDGSDLDYQAGKKLNLPDTFYDPERGSLITRTGWDKDAVMFQMEARLDSFYAGHEHADRGNFNLIAHGKNWSRDGFRSVESRYHNMVLIDGKGQGMWAPPADWMKVQESEFAVFGICNTKYAYDWFWPKGIVWSDPADPKFELERFESYKTVVNFFQENYEWEYETHPNVVNHFEGYEHPNALMWDEDVWTARVAHNPVQRAFRTAGLVKGKHPYVLVIDDIQKDDQVRLYEWILMLDMDTVALSITEKYGVEGFHSHPLKFGYEQQYTDILLGDSDTNRSGNRYRPKKGDPLLLVRVLHKGEPGIEPGYDSRPNIRVETFEKKDALEKPAARSFGLDRRLIVASRSIAPDFRILLYAHRHGDPLPETDFAQDGASLTVKWDEQQDFYTFQKDGEGLTELKVRRE
ncbi:MAG: hypothetical protein AAF571_09665 [Verrucomicrobiota bacterium]